MESRSVEFGEGLARKEGHCRVFRVVNGRCKYTMTELAGTKTLGEREDGERKDGEAGAPSFLCLTSRPPAFPIHLACSPLKVGSASQIPTLRKDARRPNQCVACYWLSCNIQPGRCVRHGTRSRCERRTVNPCMRFAEVGVAFGGWPWRRAEALHDRVETICTRAPRLCTNLDILLAFSIYVAINWT